MRKIILFSLVCISSHLMAQKSFFGVDAGVNVANQRQLIHRPGIAFGTGTGPAYLKNTIRSTFGFFYHYNLSKELGFRVNAQYMGLGYKSEADSRYDVNINYLTLPLALYYQANNHLSLNAGTYVSFTINNTKVIDQSANSVPVTSIYHKNDFGFIVGGELDVYKDLAVSINYVIGTKNIWLDDQGGSYKYTNRALQFTLIYKLRKPLTAK